MNNLEFMSPTQLTDTYSEAFKKKFVKIEDEITSVLKNDMVCKIKPDVIPKLLIESNTNDYINTITYIKTNNLFSEMDDFTSISILVLNSTFDNNKVTLLKNIAENDFYMFTNALRDKMSITDQVKVHRINQVVKMN